MKCSDIVVGDMYIIGWSTGSSAWLVVGKTIDRCSVNFTVFKCWSTVLNEQPFFVTSQPMECDVADDVTIIRAGHVIYAGEIVS